MKTAFIMLSFMMIFPLSSHAFAQAEQASKVPVEAISSLNQIAPAAGEEPRNLENTNRANVPTRGRPIVSQNRTRDTNNAQGARARNNATSAQGQFTTCTIRADTKQQYINNMLPYGSQVACANTAKGNRVTKVD